MCVCVCLCVCWYQRHFWLQVVVKKLWKPLTKVPRPQLYSFSFLSYPADHCQINLTKIIAFALPLPCSKTFNFQKARLNFNSSAWHWKRLQYGPNRSASFHQWSFYPNHYLLNPSWPPDCLPPTLFTHSVSTHLFHTILLTCTPPSRSPLQQDTLAKSRFS